LDVSFTNENIGYCVGIGGRVIKTTNSGMLWTIIQNPTVQNIRGVQFINADTGILVGDAGLIVNKTVPLEPTA